MPILIIKERQMWLSRVFSWLFVGVRILVPPVANEYIRRASFRHFASLALMIAGFSCSTHVVAKAEEENKKDITPPQEPYPGPIVEDSYDDVDKDPWRCGYEWIVVEGPSGELIHSQVPLPCDPLADIYQGCPPPFEDDKPLKNSFE